MDLSSKIIQLFGHLSLVVPSTEACMFPNNFILRANSDKSPFKATASLPAPNAMDPTTAAGYTIKILRGECESTQLKYHPE